MRGMFIVNIIKRGLSLRVLSMASDFLTSCQCIPWISLINSFSLKFQKSFILEVFGNTLLNNLPLLLTKTSGLSPRPSGLPRTSLIFPGFEENARSTLVPELLVTLVGPETS